MPYQPNMISKNSIAVRLIVIGLLVFLLLIPTLFIASLVGDRQNIRESAILEASSKWGNPQTIMGPILTLPYKKIEKDSDGEDREIFGNLHLLPESLKISGDAETNFLQRGIYEVIVYTAGVKIDGSFTLADVANSSVNQSEILWQDAFLTLGVSDPRGIKNSIQIQWNNDLISFLPGTQSSNVIDSGVSAKVPVEISENLDSVYTFSTSIDLQGSGQLYFAPLGKVTEVAMTSDWANPSFDGAFLPDTREVTAAGFTSQWKVLDFNRNHPQYWTGSGPNIIDSSFGVKFMVPLDHYQKTMRSIKYGIMFVGLTFLIFFFVEIFNKLMIHPFQYILVGFALVIFYVLLLSISEYTNFNIAYIISGLATVLLVFLYSLSIFKQKVLSLFLGTAILIMYAFMFVVLQLQDYALLLGSIGLFTVLAIVMFISRKIDWYSFGQSVNSESSKNLPPRPPYKIS